MDGTLNETDAAAAIILPSSTELFYVYGQTLEQCAKYTRGEPLLKLAKVFGKWLKVYCGEWGGAVETCIQQVADLPQTTSSSSGLKSPRATSSDGHLKAADHSSRRQRTRAWCSTQPSTASIRHCSLKTG